MLPDLGPHATFIWASYATVATVLVGYALFQIREGWRLDSKLAELERRGIEGRRSRAPLK
jgi:heme exporter protein CcmD